MKRTLGSFYRSKRFFCNSDAFSRLTQDKIPRNSVTIRVPATSANMGPGFDTIGMALDVWNELKVERSDQFEMLVTGEGEHDIPRNDSNLICQGVKAAFEAAGEEVPPLKYTCNNRIPFSRGMGSSSAGIVSGVLAGLVLSGHQLHVWGHEEFLQIAAELEGHADNVAPAIYGGIQLGCSSAAMDGNARWWSSRVNFPHGLQAILFIPDFTAETKLIRGLLPEQYPREEAVHNIQRIAFLVNGLNTGNLSDLIIGTEDKLHQTYRSPVFKHMYPLIQAANSCGAASYLSGAGPTILALSSGGAGDAYAQRNHERSENEVAEKMLAAASEIGMPGRVFITQPTHQGALVVKADPPFSEPRFLKFSPLGSV